MFSQGNKLASGILFAVLLNFKHIYMYLAVRLPMIFYHGEALTMPTSLHTLYTSCDRFAFPLLEKSRLRTSFHWQMQSSQFLWFPSGHSLFLGKFPNYSLDFSPSHAD
jgi:hypothetical protein